MSRCSMSKDIQVFTGLALHVRSMHTVRFFSTLQVNVTTFKSLLRYSIIAQLTSGHFHDPLEERFTYLKFVDVMGGTLYALTVLQENCRDTPQNMVLIEAQNTSLGGNQSGV